MSVRSPLLAAILFASIAFPSGLYGQEDEDEDALPAGLSATYTAAGRTVERVDPDIAFSWGNCSPDARLPPGPFRAQWHGRILVQTETRYVFHAYVDGAVSITLDGKLVAEGKTDAPGWISGEVLPIEFGEKELQVEYRKTGENSRVQLFWSSDRFPVEPLPVHLIFHEQKRPELALIEKGRREFEGFRCGRCHQGIADSADMPAPALTTVAASLSREDLIAKIRHSESDSAHSRMPDFGFSVDEGTAIAAYLLSASQEVKFDEPSKLAVDPNQRKNGQELAHTIGCLACHQIGAIGQNGPYSGGDLTHVADKRSVHWLFNWLKNPERVNPDHRMPVFELSEKERGHLASYLSSLKKAPERTQVSGGAAESQGADDAALVDAGRKLVADARCAACHRLPQNSVESKTHARPFAANSNWSKSCASEQLNRTGRQPRYHGVDGTAIQAFVTAHAGTTTPESPFAQGARLFEQRNCVACHRRDGAGGLEATAGAVVRADASLKGQSETLVPPVLNAVGDKLTDAALAKSIRGEQKPRMDWLRVQMPRFRHSPAQQDALLTYFVAHDRIPDGAPLHPTSPQKQADVADGEKNDASTLIAGHAIVGAQGWNCLACHQAGRFVPKNVSPATRGSDLLAFGSRMRREFFLRWTRSPLRVAPGIEMPAYERPVPGVLDGDIDRQFAALWSALNDPQFTVPTNPTAVEQFFTVKKGDGARIVHDV
ncbi:MAG: c-type cytochrome, partial [Planctomycetaceae bacterium]